MRGFVLLELFVSNWKPAVTFLGKPGHALKKLHSCLNLQKTFHFSDFNLQLR